MKKTDPDRGATSLQITVSFRDTVLQTRLLRAGESYRVGEDEDADLTISCPGSPGVARPIVRAAADGRWLCFSDAMRGHVEAEGRTFLLADLAARPESRSTGSIHEWPIALDARCRIDLGAVTLWVDSVSAPEPIARQLWAPGQRQNQKYNGLSALAHALALFVVFSMPPSMVVTPVYGSDAVRQATFHTTVPAPEDKIPDWIRALPEAAPDVATSRPSAPGRSRVRRPERGTSEEAKRLAAEAAAKVSLFAALGRTPGSNLDKVLRAESVFGGAAGEALEGLVGDGLMAYNEYGVGIVPTGSGGVGQGFAAPGYGTILDGKYRGPGGRVAQGGTKLRKHVSTVPVITHRDPEVRGSLDKEIIRRIVRRHLNEVRYCYEKELVRNHGLGGRVTVRFTIGGGGEVLDSNIQSSSLRNAAVEACVRAAVRRWVFPQPQGGAFVIVSYPFVLRAAGE